MTTATPPAQPPSTSRPQMRSGDEGSASLELAGLIVVILAMVFGLLQGALWYHARNVALAAATEGVETTRTSAGTATAGRAAAASFVNRAGGDDVLLGVNVDVQRTTTQASVTVTGQSVSVLPGRPGPAVSQTAAGPVERFTSQGAP